MFLLADGVTSEQILAILTPIAVCVAALINYFASRDAANKVAQVKTDLENVHESSAAKLDQIKATGEITHALVNNRMGAVLKTLATVSRQLANMTNNPKDMANAEVAENMAEEHDKRQAVVDKDFP